jgi:hypothetical protein
MQHLALLSLILCFHSMLSYRIVKTIHPYRRARPLCSTSSLKDDLYDQIEALSSSSSSSSSRQTKQNIKKIVSNIENSRSSNKLEFPSLWKLLVGDWELSYSNVLSRSTPTSSLAGIKRVIQRIAYDGATSRVEHILEFRSDAMSQSTAGATPAAAVSMLTSTLTKITNIRALKLIHDVKVTSNSDPAQLQLILDHVDIEVANNAMSQSKRPIYSINPLIPWKYLPLELIPLRAGNYDVS